MTSGVVEWQASRLWQNRSEGRGLAYYAPTRVSFAQRVDCYDCCLRQIATEGRPGGTCRNAAQLNVTYCQVC